MKAGPRILVVDDDTELCELLTLRIGGKGYDVTLAHTVAEALRFVASERWDAVLLDLRLGEEDGLDVLDGVGKRSPDVPVIILTAHGTIETAVEAMRRGAWGFITKPFRDHDLLQRIAHAVDGYRLRREVAGLRRIVGGESNESRLVGVSTSIEQVRDRMRRVGPTDATILVLGESGTGKELVARGIHAVSPRAKGPFMAVNCAGLTPELLESTLFGHTRGAFTGAVTEREGLLGAARKGTIFLDEVGETPPVVQAKLLRVLEDRRYTKVGSNVEEVADVRIVAATNRELRQEVTEKRFREDLYYRLHVVPIVVPPLRDRKEDIPLLAEMFLERAAARHGREAPRIGGRALAALIEHRWPGNVRELANVMEAALLLSRDEIEVEHLPGVEVGDRPSAGNDFARNIAQVLVGYSGASAAELPVLRDARDAFERAYLEACLVRGEGNVATAAKLAGRNRTDFYDLLRRHGLSPGDFKDG
ncbi:MAG: Response regulator of zinc sigma-54-dependent two-component system [Myxococcaceae bacterium]|nr:Response regulator of zinc sigma-54-dependent two-component system [Myxococcaceae bacterium]